MDPARSLRHQNFTTHQGHAHCWELLFLCILPATFEMSRNFVLIHLTRDKQVSTTYRAFFLNFLLSICPVLAILTIVSNYTTYLPIFNIVLLLLWSSFILLNQKRLQFPRLLSIDVDRFIDRSYYLTLLLVCTMIMAIDLPICPRRFAKIDDYGLSLMDIGTSSLTILNGLRFSKSTFSNQSQSNHRSSSLSKTLLRSVLPLVTIGLSRSLLVAWSGYQHNPTEYGWHWNFFLTLACVRLVSILVRAVYASIIAPRFDGDLVKLLLPALLVIGSLVLSDLLLSSFKLPSTRLDLWPPSEGFRDQSLVHANIEGLLSLPGYLALFFLSTFIFNCIRLLQQPKLSIAAIVLTVLVTIFTLLILFAYQHGTANCSRRFANIDYVLISTLLVFTSFIVFVFTLWSDNALSMMLVNDNNQVKSFKYLSRRGMVYFLVSNLLTGLVNFSLDTVANFLPPAAEADPVTGAFRLPIESQMIQYGILTGYTAACFTLTWIIDKVLS